VSRISKTFQALQKEDRCALIPYLTAGDPSMTVTHSLLHTLADAGADVIELGVPFSDPIADGPVIQRASQRALQNQVTVDDILGVVRDVRSTVGVPIVVFSYLNPLLQFGFERFAIEAAKAGVDAVLLTDMPLEESAGFEQELKENDLDLIRLAAPTSTDRRLEAVVKDATGFIYAVARAGVTGTSDSLSHDAELLVSRLRNFTKLPIAVGFGISTPAQVSEVAAFADGVVVGSAIVSEIEKNNGRKDLVQNVGAFVRSLSNACLRRSERPQLNMEAIV
jgi:tryptophan synthase alpha chain